VANPGMSVELPIPEDRSAIVVQIVPCPEVLEYIIHESVHVWQFMIEHMGEEYPGDETEAYTIQHIARELLLQYQRVTGVPIAVHDQRKTRLQKRKSPIQQSSGDSKTEGGTERSPEGNDKNGGSPQGRRDASGPQEATIEGRETNLSVES
jgi:hypothetical protein